MTLFEFNTVSDPNVCNYLIPPASRELKMEIYWTEYVCKAR